jgi:hypothetical protein
MEDEHHGGERQCAMTPAISIHLQSATATLFITIGLRSEVGPISDTKDASTA